MSATPSTYHISIKQGCMSIKSYLKRMQFYLLLNIMNAINITYLTAHFTYAVPKILFYKNVLYL